MGKKDITEKILEDYNDVFADIVNGFIFEGKQIVKPEKLNECGVHSQYKSDDSVLHEQERDILKRWTDGKINIALCDIENQTCPDKYMPMRIIGYDGASYRSQLPNPHNPVPIMTIVLYFGTEQRWNYARNLKGVLKIPPYLNNYVNDYRINVFEVAWMKDEEVNRFHSDFKIVANYFVNKRKNPNYIPDDTTKIRHVDEVLKLLAVMEAFLIRLLQPKSLIKQYLSL